MPLANGSFKFCSNLDDCVNPLKTSEGLPLSEFTKNKARKDGLNCKCKACASCYYKDNRDRMLNAANIRNKLARTSRTYKAIEVDSKFGKLTVLEIGKLEGKRTLVKCICECGNITISKKHVLLDGNKRSCGCLRSEKSVKLGEWRVNRRVGEKYGKFTIIGIGEEKYKRQYEYECQCECGNIRYRTLSQLRYNKIKSCGCDIVKPDGFDGTMFTEVLRSYKE